MAVLNFVDRYSSTLASGYTSGGGSISVSVAPTGVSGACNFYVIVQAEGANTEEVFLVTNISGTTLTVVGAQDGTTASNHGAGAAIIGSIMGASAFQLACGLQLVEQHTASSSATLDFTTGITSAFDEYEIHFINVIPASNAVSMGLQCSTDGGANYDATNGRYPSPGSFWYAAAGQTFSNASTTYFTIVINLSNDAAHGLSGVYRITNPLSTTYKKLIVGTHVNYDSGLSAVIGWNRMGEYNQAVAVNAIRFLMSSGNIASGTIRIYGVSKG